MVDRFLKSEQIRFMDWPARSTGIKPINLVFESLERIIITRFKPDIAIQEIETTFREVR